MKVQLLVAIICFLATTSTGCISQQDRNTMTQWKEFRDHLWAEQAPATTDTPAELPAADQPAEAQGADAQATEAKEETAAGSDAAKPE